MSKKDRLYFIYNNGVVHVFNTPLDMYARNIPSNERLNVTVIDYV